MKRSYLIAGSIALLAFVWVISGQLFSTPNKNDAVKNTAGAKIPQVRVKRLTAHNKVGEVVLFGRTEADRKVTVVKADATRDSEKLRGQGDAERNSIFNSAFGKDPDFFAFYRSMQAYEAGLKSSDTRLLLSPNTEFFRYFNNSAGKAR